MPVAFNLSDSGVLFLLFYQAELLSRALIFISSMVADVKHSSVACLLAICLSSLEESLRLLPMFKTALSVTGAWRF